MWTKYLIPILFCLPFLVNAASPSRIGTDTISKSTADGDWTLSHTIPATGQNRGLIVVAACQGSGQSTMTITWNGTSMTEIVELTAVNRWNGLVFYLANPETGTQNLVFSCTRAANKQIFAFVFTLQDVAQSSPVDVSGQANGAEVALLSKSVTTSVNGDLILTWLDHVENDALTSDGSQTRIGAVNYTTGSVDYFTLDELPQTSAGAQSTGFSWVDVSSPDLYVVALKYLAPTEETTAPPAAQFILFGWLKKLIPTAYAALLSPAEKPLLQKSLTQKLTYNQSRLVINILNKYLAKVKISYNGIITPKGLINYLLTK